jgi:hypothetical protein
MMGTIYQPTAPYPQKEYTAGALPAGVRAYSDIIAEEKAEHDKAEKQAEKSEIP